MKNTIKKLTKWFLQKEEFKYVCDCENVGLYNCPAHSPVKHLICTRKVGHKGKHVACGSTRHRIAVWGEDNE